MAWFRFIGEQLLGLVKETSLKKDLQDGIVGAVKGITGLALSKLNQGKVEEAKTLLAETYKGSEAIAGAVVKNTPAENMVDQSIIHTPAAEVKSANEPEPELPPELCKQESKPEPKSSTPIPAAKTPQPSADVQTNKPDLIQKPPGKSA